MYHMVTWVREQCSLHALQMEYSPATSRRDEIVPSFWILPSLKSALHNHEGPTEMRKGHSTHWRRAPKSKTNNGHRRNEPPSPAGKQPIDQSISWPTGRWINESIQWDNGLMNRSISIERNWSISANRRIKSNWETRQQSTKQRTTRDQIVFSSTTAKRKVNINEKTKTPKRNHSNITKRSRWINPSLPYKK